MLEHIHNTLQGVVVYTWPVVIISVVILASTRITYLIKTKEKFVLYKELLMLGFIVYILCLFQIVTFQDDTVWSSNNFIPFKEIMRYNITSRLFLKNVLGNMIMFLPFGFFISYYLKADRVNLPILLTVVASIAIEIVQMSIGRVFDVDDILLNLIGGITGYLIYKFLAQIGNKYPKFFHNEMILNIFVFLGCLVIIFGLFIILV